MGDNFAVYLPQPEEPNEWGIDITGAGAASISPGMKYPPENHPSDHYFDWEHGRTLEVFQLILITNGGGTFQTDHLSATTISAPFIFVVFPGIWHRYRPDPSTGWQESWVGFRGRFTSDLQKSGTLSPEQPIFKIGNSEMLLAQFQLIQDEVKSEAFGFRNIAATALMQILALATHLPSRKEEENHPMRKTVRRACFLMRQRSEGPLCPEELAAELNTGYTYFRRMFRKYTGISPKRYHSQLRLQRIKRLLRDGSSSVSEIADKFGFASPFHLSNWFKKETGLSPRDWRQST
ncbi:AraC family transcriptional regulator [Pelagicoccus sp. SDUM812002]|uniref:helix-turn-helix domain-containing protein n=1 Tax=Pelagicoccus sp. SDUM812002 TaxID=3041266 RepID=UPI00280C6D6B|nr:AraC family transcriptional regulator [Pelagicoccus sp. SDUM812002]MDQ8188317.1 AraC family transcriptional regulator [Pelagicoccus sp. SDUM812002]